MVIGATLVATVSLLLGLGADQSRVLWQGPVLAGDTVVWGEEAGGTGTLHRWTLSQGDRVLYRSDSLALTGPLAATRTLVAFGRSYPGCAPQPNLVCPQVEDAVVGPPRGPYTRLVPPRKCSMPTLGNTVALDNGVAAYLELDCARQRLRVLVRDVGHGRGAVVLRSAPVSSGCCRDIAIAGRYVAWSEGRDVVVYDRIARKTAYRARVGREGIGVEIGFDLQRDGKLAVAYRFVEMARAGPTTIAWFSRTAPRLHVLRSRGSETRIRIAGNRIAFEHFVRTKTSVLVVATLAGETEAIARVAPPVRLRGGFDFDGRRIVWASDRVTSGGIDCPPPGQGRPCVKRESGVTSIWLRPAGPGRPRLVARLPFVDTIARS